VIGLRLRFGLRSQYIKVARLLNRGFGLDILLTLTLDSDKKDSCVLWREVN